MKSKMLLKVGILIKVLPCFILLTKRPHKQGRWQKNFQERQRKKDQKLAKNTEK